MAKRRKTLERLKEVRIMKQRQMHTLSSEEQAKAYLHPKRMEIVSLLLEPHTQSQVAAHFGVHPANLIHHFKKLEKAGLIQIVEERDLGKVVEKYYQAIARRFELRPRPGVRGARRALSVLHSRLGDALDSVDPSDERILCLIRRSRISEERREEFFQRLESLVHEFEQSDIGEESNATYEVVASMYPVVR